LPTAESNCSKNVEKSYLRRNDDTAEGKEWVPFILSLMAFFFYIPRGVWNIFSSYSGLALADLMTAARKSAKTGADDPYIELAIGSMATTLRKVHTSKVVRYGSGLFNLYIVMKVAFCDLTVREMGNVNNWTVQCVLMVNMFNEKIFIFLWFWFAMLLFCTSINLCTWIRRRFSKTARKTFLYNVLTDCGLDTTEADREEFYREVVQDDGLLVLLLLDANGGRLQSGELAHQLWISKFPQTDAPIAAHDS
ncbi:Innexin, partial [Teladorsagia circumcincta]